MDFTKSRLFQEIAKLNLNSAKAVQSGKTLGDLDAYLHVDRPIEEELREQMRTIEDRGGGIVLLVGSAGDGKSHLLSRVRNDFDWNDDSFYNDATASCSPNKTAVETLKEALSDFRDVSIDSTRRKMVLAVNLGKLNAFVEDSEVKNEYSTIVNATTGIFDDDNYANETGTGAIRIVQFTKEQIFEVFPKAGRAKSNFLTSILERIARKSDENPFFRAFCADMQNDDFKTSPLHLNYRILQSIQVRDTIVSGIIEAIVRFKLAITPREFLDFVNAILVDRGLRVQEYPADYCKRLLPSLLYCGGDNQIQKAFAKLDPIGRGSTEHDKMLAELFTSHAIPDQMERKMTDAGFPNEIIERLNGFYSNNGRDLEPTAKFVFRAVHILAYHSESNTYDRYMELLLKILDQDKSAYAEIFELVGRVMPRHFGSFYKHDGMVPLGVQGGKYKLFVHIDMEPMPIETTFDANRPTRFPLAFALNWRIGNDNESLKVDYQMFNYLTILDNGRLVSSFESDRNLAFGTFVRNLAEKNRRNEVVVVSCDGCEQTLKKTFGNVTLT